MKIKRLQKIFDKLYVNKRLYIRYWTELANAYGRPVMKLEYNLGSPGMLRREYYFVHLAVRAWDVYL